MDRPAINGLSLRRVTRYMTLLAKEWSEHGRPVELPNVQERVRRDVAAPAIPDPWDIPRENAVLDPVNPRTEPKEMDQAASTPAHDAPSPTAQDAPDSPWQDDPVTVAHGHALSGETTSAEDISDGFWSLDIPDEDNAPLPWELPQEEDEPEQPEEPAFRPIFASAQEQDDFARAMMVLSSDDDFLVTGLGKRAATPPVVRDEPTSIRVIPRERPSQTRSGQTRSGQTRSGQTRSGQARSAVAQSASRGVAKSKPSFGKGSVPLIRIVLAVLIALVVAAAGLATWYFVFSDDTRTIPNPVNASVVYLGDENLGCVEDGLAVAQVLDNARENVARTLSLPAVLEKDLHIEPMMVDARFLAPLTDMQNAVLARAQVLVEATGVYVDGRLVAIGRSEDAIGEVFEDALAPYRLMQSDRSILELGFAEQIELKAVTAPPDDLLEQDELYRVLITGEQDAPDYYQVQEGDSLTAIAQRYDLTLGNLRYANPTFIGTDLIKVGDRLCVTPPQGILNVRFVERVTEEITLPYETVTKSSDKLYTTQTEVEQKGVEGLREVVADKVYIAGMFAHQDILQETVLREPVDRIVVRGTKKPTNSGGSGTYIWPAEGSVSSRFGSRWGRQHKGLDIAASTGTPIYAARDGKVTFSGTNGSYGKLVKIDHGGGVETRYAHCSTLKVSSGDVVKKGQIIALVGSTGNSTGPHLHFEVLVNGTQKDPENYLP
jgi:murein DD-endopeptidase MepM/ murein hydrolase activator NlpD